MAREYEYEPERGSTAIARREDVAIIDADPISIRDNTFAKAGSKALAKAVDKKLRAPIDPKVEADILPTGELYMSHVHVRRRLNDAIGPMGWALRPVSDLSERDNQLVREFALIVLGRVVATAFGSAKYYPTLRGGASNPRADKADAAEMVKSNALTRCCKDLGIGSECWDRRWCDEWREKYAVHVWVKKGGGDKTETISYWRRLDQKPFRGEYAVVEDSPNQDRWRKQWTGWIEMTKKEIAASREVAKAIAETRREAKDANVETRGGQEPPARGGESRDFDKSEPRKSGDRTSAPVSHGNVKPEDRRFKIMKANILKKEDTYTLYGVQMADGTVYTTFSSSMYEKLGKHWAQGDLIEISSERKVTKGKEHQNIIEWTVVRKGAQS